MGQATSPLPKKKDSVFVGFGTAIMSLLEGKRIVKEEWPEGYYGFLKDSKVLLHKPAGTTHDWLISEGDLAGNDWRII